MLYDRKCNLGAKLKKMSKEVAKKIKVKELPQLIDKLGLSPEQEIKVTIEKTDNELLKVMDEVGINAQEKGLTPEKLEELLADES